MPGYMRAGLNQEEVCTMIQRNDSHAPSSRYEVLLAVALRKSYGGRLALRDLSFSLKAGHVMGFLGPNGAGKTTAIRILTTILQPDSGHFFVDSTSSEEPERIRRKIGVLPESLGFPKHMSGIEFLTYFGQLYGRTATGARTHGLALLEEVGLQQRATSLIGSYSRGMRQRLGIARALVNDPAVVFLDEPTLGLDPQGQQELLALVKWIARRRNAGVVLCTHQLSDVEGSCDDVLILSAGQVVVSGPVAEVIGRAQQNALLRNVIRIRVPPSSVAEAQRVLGAMPKVLRVTLAGEAAGWLAVELADADGTSTADHFDKNKVLEALIRAEIPILGVETAGGRLQDVFFRLTEEAIK
jgi:ABC-2 type transport system ATP-binding protein